jgi:hypothetical protein
MNAASPQLGSSTESVLVWMAQLTAKSQTASGVKKAPRALRASSVSTSNSLVTLRSFHLKVS